MSYKFEIKTASGHVIKEYINKSLEYGYTAPVMYSITERVNDNLLLDVYKRNAGLQWVFIERWKLRNGKKVLVKGGAK